MRCVFYGLYILDMYFISYTRKRTRTDSTFVINNYIPPPLPYIIVPRITFYDVIVEQDEDREVQPVD